MDSPRVLAKQNAVPLYLQVVAYLKAKIADGTYASSANLPSEAELTVQLGVSRPTVRRALALLLQEGLITRVPGRGTFVSDSPHGVSRVRAGTVALLLPEMRDAFVMRIFSGVERVLAQGGYHVIVCNTGNEIHSEQQLIHALWDSHKVDGFIVMPVDSPQPPEAFRYLMHLGTPLVFVDRYYEDCEIPSVASDNVHGGYILTQHLAAHGYRRIGFVTRPNLYVTSVAHRVRGYRQALEEASIPYEPGLVFQGLLPFLSEKQIADKFSARLVEYDRQAIAEFLSDQNRPSAVIACNEIIAVQVWETCRQIGLRIPQDLALAGFDDDAVAALLAPPLTTIRQDPREMGSLAARMLLDLLNGQKLTEQHVLLPVELIVRQSCGE